MSTKDFFFCYNRKTMMELKSKGFKFLFCAKHEISDCKFWLFERTDDLNKVLEDIKR